jgi:hypothetical protein
MNKREKMLWATVAVAGAGALWYSNGMRVPWRVFKHVGFVERRKLENHQADFLLALNKYDDVNPGVISEEVFADAESEFTETMIDNDVMGVWNRFFKRKHPFYPNWDSVINPIQMEEEDDDE